jgi:hypothetical protein
MDALHFDILIRSLTEFPSRRAVVRTLVGFGLGGALGWLELASAEAKNDKKKKRKKQRRKQRRRRASTPPFCAEKNFCLIGELAGRCETSGTQCLCTITESTGEPFCGQFVRFSPDGCDGCTADETCVRLGGEFCGPGIGCAETCPNPR